MEADPESLTLVSGFLGNFTLEVYRDDHVGEKIIQDREWEPWITSVIEEKCSEGDVAVDIGANLGAHTLSMANQTGEFGRVLAFEPNPIIFPVLQRNVRRNGFDFVELYQTGISSSDGRSDLSIRTDNFGSSTLYNHSDSFEFEDVEIELTSLDSFVESIDFLKMDVEGAEVEIIDSLNLDDIGAMVIEVHPQFLDDSEVSRMTSILEDSGEVSRLHRQIVWE